MNAPLVALLCVLLLPLFIGSWRTSLLGLACQGWLTAWFRLRGHGLDTQDVVALVDLAVLRGVWAPWLLYRALSRQHVPARNDVIPPNLLSWTLALAAVLLSFNFAELLAADGARRPVAAVSASGVLLGFLVLSTQTGMLSQIVGVLRVENAIALFEQSPSAEAHGDAVWLQTGQALVSALSVALYAWHLRAALAQPTAAIDTWESTW